MNDASLDRQLQSLMAAEPSPEFLARVRARVAEEPEPGVWRTSWMCAVAGAMAIVIVVAMTWQSSDPVMESSKPVRQAQRQPPAVAEPMDAPTQTLAAPPPIVRSHPAASARPGMSRVVATGKALDEIDLPQVIVGENEVRAYTALVASVRESRFNAAVPVAPDLSAPFDVKELSPVEPLEIEPIARLAVVQSEGERP